MILKIQGGPGSSCNPPNETSFLSTGLPGQNSIGRIKRQVERVQRMDHFFERLLINNGQLIVEYGVENLLPTYVVVIPQQKKQVLFTLVF